MSDILLADIQDAINKNLSAQVAAVLRERLELIDKLEGQVARDTKTIRDLREEATRQALVLKAANERIDAFVARESSFVKSEQAVAAANLAASIHKAQLDGAMEVTRLVFANNFIKRRVNGTVPVASANPNQYNSNAISTEEVIDG